MQDTSQRIIIVARRDLENWQIANAIAHVAASIGNALGPHFATGAYFEDASGARYPRNAQFPIIVKRANSSEQLKNLLEKARSAAIAYHGFVREMLEQSDDTVIERMLSQKGTDAVELLAAGVFGPNEALMSLTKKFGLWDAGI